jgi:hypothetical protein
LCGVGIASGAVFWLTFWLLLLEVSTTADWVAFDDFFMVLSPFLNGCAVFAHKHALAMAHAIEGGKCNGVGKVARKGQPQAGGSEHLELHGAFSIALRAPGAELLSRFGFLA